MLDEMIKATAKVRYQSIVNNRVFFQALGKKPKLQVRERELQ